MDNTRFLQYALKVIQVGIDPVIWVMGVYVLLRLIERRHVLSRLKDRVDKELGGYEPKNVKVSDRTLRADLHLNVNLVQEQRLKEEFDKESSVYIFYAQLISVFPLLGILGTVAGLMLNVSATDPDAMLASLDTALSSTLYGLFFAIALRIYDSHRFAPMIYLIESKFNDYESLYHNIQMEQAQREGTAPRTREKENSSYMKNPARFETVHDPDRPDWVTNELEDLLELEEPERPEYRSSAVSGNRGPSANSSRKIPNRRQQS